MKLWNKECFRKKLDAVQRSGYAFGDSVKSVEQRFGISRSEIVKLDANENFFIPRNSLLRLIIEVLDSFDPRIYPQDDEQELKEKIGEYVRVHADCITVGCGSDELMERITRLFLENGEQALTISPTFSMYRHAVNLQKAELIEDPLKEDFSINADTLLSKITSKTRMLFLCSPNNPTANQFKISEMEYLIDVFPGIVVVDEAYVEFAENSIVQLTKKFENLVVLRTFSKAFGLAGLRLGYCVANSEIAKVLAKEVGLPYPANSIALKVGAKILDALNIVETAVKQLKVEREKLIASLNKINGVTAFDSQANFVLFKTAKPLAEVYELLLKRGIIVRKLGNVLKFENCFRTTVGLPEMNAKLVEALKEICG